MKQHRLVQRIRRKIGARMDKSMQISPKIHKIVLIILRHCGRSVVKPELANIQQGVQQTESVHILASGLDS